MRFILCTPVVRANITRLASFSRGERDTFLPTLRFGVTIECAFSRVPRSYIVSQA